MTVHRANFASQRRARGFTLIESALVTVIVGVGAVAMLELLAAGTVTNQKGAESTVAMNLARSIREMSLGLSFADPTTPTNWGRESGETLYTIDDIDDLNGATYSPPIDARRTVQSDMVGWSQQVAVQSVDPDRLSFATVNGSTPASRITVTIRHNNKTVYTTSWTVLDASQ